MIYLDYAATSYTKPDCVIDAVCAALHGCGNADRGVNRASLDAGRILFDTRRMLSDLFGGYGPTQVAFTCNSTEALNIVIAGTLTPTDHAITTACEHNSVLRPLFRLEDAGMALTVVPADTAGRVDYAAFEAAIRPETKAIVCTHASNLTGNVLDIARIGEVAAAHGLLFIVDASQTAGVFPIDMHAMHIDILCVTGHKGLLGPQGTGAILVRDGVDIAPWKVGGTGVKTFDRGQPDTMPTRLEAGTLNIHGIAGLHAALGFLRETGIDAVRAHESALAARFLAGVRDIPGVTVYGDVGAAEHAAVISLNLADEDSGAVADVLFTEYGIQTRAGGHCAPLMHEALGTRNRGAVRFSFGWATTEAEVDAAIEALRELASEE